MLANAMNKKQFYLLVGLLGLIAILLGYAVLGDKNAFGASVVPGRSGFNEIEYLNSTRITGEGGCRIPTSTSTCSVRNSTGGDIWVDLTSTQMFLSKTATSSLIVFAATSTVEGWPDYNLFQNNVNGSWRPIIASTTVATNTRPVISGLTTLLRSYSTSSMGSLLPPFIYGDNLQLTQYNNWIGTPPAAGVGTSTAILLRSNEILNFVVQAPSNRCAAGSTSLGSTNPSYGINCHSATSTDRAIIDAVFKYYRFKNSGE